MVSSTCHILFCLTNQADIDHSHIILFQVDQTESYRVDFVLVYSDAYFNSSSSKSLFDEWTKEGGVLKSFLRCQFYIFRAAFLYKSVMCTFPVLTVCVCVFLAKRKWAKNVGHTKLSIVPLQIQIKNQKSNFMGFCSAFQFQKKVKGRNIFHFLTSRVEIMPPDS